MNTVPPLNRFVLLHHNWPFPHYDLMLEWHGVLKTWRLPEIPKPGVALTVEAIGDHRLAYLDYEGPVSGGRGEVRRVDAGGYQGDLRDMTKPLSIYFRGNTLRGWYQLTPLSGASWQLVWLGDAA
jgi:hypothetical protein